MSVGIHIPMGGIHFKSKLWTACGASTKSAPKLLPTCNSWSMYCLMLSMKWVRGTSGLETAWAVAASIIDSAMAALSLRGYSLACAVFHVPSRFLPISDCLGGISCFHLAKWAERVGGALLRA